MIFRPFIVSILMLLAFDLSAADYSTPSGRVKDLTDRFISIVQNTSLDRSSRWNRLANVIYDGFDFRSMSQNLVSRSWRPAGEDERRKYTDFFAQYLEAIYSPGLQNIILRSESRTGDRATVETVIHAEGDTIPVHFRLKNNGGDWFAYDIMVESRSLIEVYHSIYTAITSHEGLEGLSSGIRRRVDRYRGGGASYSDER